MDARIEQVVTSGEITGEYWPREEPALQRELSLTPAEIDKGADLRTAFLSSSHTEHPSHLHLNALALWNGDIHALFNSRGAVVDLVTQRVLLQDEQLVGGHNLVVDGNLLFACATRKKAVCIFDLTAGSRLKTIQLPEIDEVQQLLRDSRPKGLRRLSPGASRNNASDPLFVRGLQVSGDEVFVGISPATILHLNWKTGRFLDHFQYSKDVNVCVHGLRLHET